MLVPVTVSAKLLFLSKAMDARLQWDIISSGHPKSLPRTGSWTDIFMLPAGTTNGAAVLQVAEAGIRGHRIHSAEHERRRTPPAP